MILLTYKKGIERRTGVLIDKKIIDINLSCFKYMIEKGEDEEFAESLCSVLAPTDMLRLIKGGENTLSFIKSLIQKMSNDNEVIVELDSVKLTAPLLRANVLRDFLAFKPHVQAAYKRRGMEIPKEWYEIPVYYKGDPAIFYGTDEEVPWPKYTQLLDFELEIAAIVYKKGKDISKGEAKNFILGYSIFNDFSARDIQMKEMSLLLGPAKGKDFAKGLGPWIVTIDELPDIRGLKVKASVNGEVWCEGRVEDMQWSFEEMINYVSQDEYIRPGDVFGSGTVDNCCGLDRGRYLKPNDVVELEVEKIGVLRNRVVRTF
jgi:2-keto-4-pentenoate hydratase/2-oxohepta-3-ene-1,7-dioic acid hydratase in catechol pathway